MKPDLTHYLGKSVSVTVDRPLGSRHPRHPDLVYPVNYGFVPGTVSGDGMPIDMYVLGMNEPRSQVDAVIVIAVVVRADDAEDKLVAAPFGYYSLPAEIAEAVEFQERYYDSRLVV